MSTKEQLEQDRLSQERRNRRQAALLSGLLFTSVLALCFFLTAFTIQDPPPGEQFVAVGFADLGETDEAGGVTDSENPSEVIEEAVTEEVAASAPEPVVEESAEDIVTQEASEMAVNVNPEPTPDPEPEPEPVPQDRTAHLFRNPGNPSAGGGGSQGQTDGVGNEGEEAGKIDGRGVVSGDFGDAMLNGGTMIGEPRLSEKPQEQGTVRVNIVVDGRGKVIQASPDYTSAVTTLTDSYHVNLAMRAAKTALFDADPMKPRRTGYITIRFDLE